MDIKVSVIIPVYNCEKYISECIESLISQTLKECEFIFVNDGSTDKSKEVIEGYAKNDSRIKIINQENRGVSVARNIGLENAVGEYIGFVDADDYIDKDMYKKLYYIIVEKKIDLVISNFEQELDGKKIINKLDITTNSILNKDEIINKILPQFLQHEKLNTVCNKLFKAEIIKDFNIKFPNRVSLGEDGLFNINYFSNVESLIYLDYCGYHYREVEGSATRNIFEKDYFTRALEVYHEDIPSIYYKNFNKEYLEKLKAMKLITNVISYIHVYFKPQDGISFRKRYDYVNRMINNKSVSQLINKYRDIICKDKSKYEILLINLIKNKSVMAIYILTVYSRLRCK